MSIRSMRRPFLGLALASTLLMAWAPLAAQTPPPASSPPPDQTAPQAPAPAQPADNPPAADLPADPVHVETLRTYFDEIHYGSWLRRSWSAGYEAQKKELPPWYPPEIFDELVKAELDMDLAAVALPVYQKYMSESAGQHAIKLFATPDGQAMAAKMFAAQAQARAAGENANDAYSDALKSERDKEQETVNRMLATVTPQDRQELAAFMASREWTRITDHAIEISAQLNQAELDKQKEIALAVNGKHHDQLVAARKAYEDAHNGPTK